MLPELNEIKAKRTALGLKQTELARIAEVSQSLIAKIEAGKIDPSYHNAKRVFDALERKSLEKGIKAGDVMTRETITLEEAEKVEKAVKLMKKHDVSQIPVLRNGVVAGVISEQTILEKVTAGADLRAVSKSKIREVMDQAPPRVDEATPVGVVSALLKVNQCVLIEEKGKLAGIITKADLLKVLK